MLKKAKYYLWVLPIVAMGNIAQAADVNFGGIKNESNLMGYVDRAISWFIAIAGILSVVFIMIGGFQYITSGTSKDGTTKAKNTITYAIIGLVIVGLALVIRNFVLTKFIGASTSDTLGGSALPSN